MANGNEGSTPALGDMQARKLLEAPPARVKDLHSRQGVMHFRIKGKRSKIRFVPVNAAAQRMIEDYLALTGHRNDVEGALFRAGRSVQADGRRILAFQTVCGSL